MNPVRPFLPNCTFLGKGGISCRGCPTSCPGHPESQGLGSLGMGWGKSCPGPGDKWRFPPPQAQSTGSKAVGGDQEWQQRIGLAAGSRKVHAGRALEVRQKRWLVGRRVFSEGLWAGSQDLGLLAQFSQIHFSGPYRTRIMKK